jgi:hypothetical protein
MEAPAFRTRPGRCLDGRCQPPTVSHAPDAGGVVSRPRLFEQIEGSELAKAPESFRDADTATGLWSLSAHLTGTDLTNRSGHNAS